MLIFFVCQFVPFAGPMVMMGYLFEVIEAKHRHGALQYPLFDMDRIGAYLTRGLWPLLVSLVVAIPVMVVVMPIFFIFVISGIAANPSRDAQPFVGLLMVIGVIALMVVMFAVQVLTAPLLLRAGLSQDFASAFSMSYLKDFLGRVGTELVLSLLFLLVTAPFVALAGVLAFCIGLYAATVVILFAQYHLYYQLYELYLARGGAPIPLKS